MESDLPPRMLLVFASTHGHTAIIATRLAERIRESGVEVTLLRAEFAATDPTDYDAVVAGGSLHTGKHQKELLRWATAHRQALETVPNAFFSVSLSAADDDAESRDTTAGCIEDFVQQTGWRPKRSVALAGALQYSKYGWATKLAMRWMMKRGGHPTDSSRDYDYTDWEAVDRLGDELAALADGIMEPVS